MLLRYDVGLSQGKEGVGRLRHNYHDRDRSTQKDTQLPNRSLNFFIFLVERPTCNHYLIALLRMYCSMLSILSPFLLEFPLFLQFVIGKVYAVRLMANKLNKMMLLKAINCSVGFNMNECARCIRSARYP